MLLGFDALGRFALGQLGQNYTTVNQTIPQAAGTGVAGQLTPNPAGILVGVAGIGVAGSITDTRAKTLTGVAGTGVVGAITPNPTGILVGVAGIGLARALTPSPSVTLQPAVGIGVAGVVVTTSTSPVIVHAVGIGVAGTITTSVGKPLGQAAGGGVAGQITAVISGGGGAKLQPVEEPTRRDRRIKTGLLPLERRPAAPKPAPKNPLLPPIDDAPPLAPESRPPIPDVAPATIDTFDDTGRQIMEAHAASISVAHRRQSEQDEQDAADIADVLAMLD